MSKGVTKAGGIIITTKNEEEHLVLVYRANLDDWTFPKGSIEEWELLDEAALRKSKEETGLDLEVVKRLPSLNYNYADGTPCTVNFYLMKSLSTEFSPNKDITMARWVPLDSVRKKLTTKYLQDYFDKLINENLLSN